MCNCPVCTESQEIEDMISRKDNESLSKKVNDLWERLLTTEQDRDVSNCILKGEWPNSIEILERCLKKAKEKAGVE